MGTRPRIKTFVRDAIALEDRKKEVLNTVLKRIVNEQKVSFREAKSILKKQLFWSNVKRGFNEINLNYGTT
jgi:hypothetical protein